MFFTVYNNNLYLSQGIKFIESHSGHSNLFYFSIEIWLERKYVALHIDIDSVLFIWGFLW